MHATSNDTPIPVFTELVVAARDRDKAQSEVRALRGLLADAERDGRAWCEQLGVVQARCSELIEEARAARRELTASRARECNHESEEMLRREAEAKSGPARERLVEWSFDDATGPRPPKKPVLCSAGCHYECDACAAKPGTPTLCGACAATRRECNARAADAKASPGVHPFLQMYATPRVTSENARDLFGTGSVLGEGLHDALKPGGKLDAPPPMIVKATGDASAPCEDESFHARRLRECHERISDLILKGAELHARQQSRIDTLTSSLEHLLLQEASTEDGLGLGWECVGCVDHGFIAPVSSPEEIEHVPGCPLFTTENDHG